jgi:putative N6-adenine-specific DNA methylase
VNPTQNLEKRIKRHVTGKSHRFFAATLPGHEPLCLDELLTAGISTDPAARTGGVEFTGRLHDVYLANLNLRTANRILMRLFTFTAFHFNQLEKTLADLPWELFICPDAVCDLHITSKQSRLIHTDAIGERVKKAVIQRLDADVFAGNRNRPGEVQQIFVRVRKDRFTISLDTSGALLHKRGIKTQGGRAPVRETMAAAILLQAGYQAGEILIDPMCGTGTFSLEAAMMTKHIPAGWYRDFAFTHWPAFKPKQWHYIRQEAKKAITCRHTPVIFASDSDTIAIQKLDKIVCDHLLADAIKVKAADFFTLNSRDFPALPEKSDPAGLIVLNPPYGHRLGHRKDAEETVLRICQKLKHDFNGWKFALLLPDHFMLSKLPFTVDSRQLSHGGLTITLATGRIS